MAAKRSPTRPTSRTPLTSTTSGRTTPTHAAATDLALVQPHTPQAADLGHAPLCQPVRGDRWGHPFVVRELEHPRRGVEDLLGALLGPLEGEPLELVGHLDEPAGVDHVVGRVEDA